MTPEEVARAAGVVTTEPPRVAHCNLFKGAAYPIAHDHKLVSCWGGWEWLPTGPHEDAQLRAAFDARDGDAFKRRANALRLGSNDPGNHTTPSQQWTMCSMRKGDLIIVRDSYSAKPPARGPTKYLIGVFSTEVDEPHGTIWARCRDYGVAPTAMANAVEADRLRMWRPVVWVREGDWQGELAPSTIAAMAGVQSKTITIFTASINAVLDMLKNSRPFVPSLGMPLSHGQPAPSHGKFGSVQHDVTTLPFGDHLKTELPASGAKVHRVHLEDAFEAAGFRVDRKQRHSNLFFGDESAVGRNSFCVSAFQGGKFFVSMTPEAAQIAHIELSRCGDDAEIRAWAGNGGRHRRFLFTESMPCADQAALVKAVLSRLLANAAPVAAAAASGSAKEQPTSCAQRHLTAGAQKRPSPASSSEARKRPERAPEVAPVAQQEVDDQNCPLVCPIDQDGHMTEPVSLPCGCNFERSAIKGWLQRENTCPICRSKVPRGFDANTLGVNKLIQQNAALLCKCTK